MLDKKVLELLNLQIQKEFYSAYLYLVAPFAPTIAICILCCYCFNFKQIIARRNARSAD